MKTDASSPAYFTKIQECEAAIVRIRAAIRAGVGSNEQVGADFEMIRKAVTPRLISYTRQFGGPESSAGLEALDAMYDRLFDDIWSLSFVSLETQFGAYLRSMPIRVIQNIRRKYAMPGSKTPLERLDEVSREEGLPRHELEGDARAESALYAIGDREVIAEALAQLAPEERLVIDWRLDGLMNGTIAQKLGVSEPTATRIYQRAVKKIRAVVDA